jgi:hypothetical protein
MDSGLEIPEIELSVPLEIVMMPKKETADRSDRRETWSIALV